MFGCMACSKEDNSSASENYVIQMPETISEDLVDDATFPDNKIEEQEMKVEDSSENIEENDADTFMSGEESDATLEEDVEKSELQIEIKDVLGNVLFSVSENCGNSDDQGNIITSEIKTACNAYVEYLGEDGKNIAPLLQSNSNEFVFCFAYINDDYIPEMIIRTNSGISGCDNVCVLCYTDGNVISQTLHCVDCITVASQEEIIDVRGDSLGFYDLTYEIDSDGEWVILYGCKENLVPSQINERLLHIETNYYIDNEEVKFEDYEKCKKINWDEFECFLWEPYSDDFETYPCTAELFEIISVK